MCIQMWKIWGCSLVVIQDFPLCRKTGLQGLGNMLPDGSKNGVFQALAASVNSSSAPAAKGHFTVPDPNKAA